MKRYALLIEASEVPGEGSLPGAVVDVKNHHRWLYSKSGGDWYNHEIVTLNTPRVAEVKKAIEIAGKLDYAFVAFSGHGYHSQELDQTKVCLRDGRLSVRELLPDTNRCTCIIDACRNVLSELLFESYEVKAERSVGFAKAALQKNFRQEFEGLVAKAEKGPEFLYSCDLHESAGEAPQSGGYFSRFLVESGNTFATQNTDGSKWMSVKAAFTNAAEGTTARNRTQHPRFEPGRRLVHFPYGV